MTTTPQTYAPQDPRVREAEAQEQTEATNALLNHLQQRVVLLNMEVRVRDERIAALEKRLSEATPPGETAVAVTDSGHDEPYTPVP